MSNDQRISMTAPIGRRRFLTAVGAVMEIRWSFDIVSSGRKSSE